MGGRSNDTQNTSTTNYADNRTVNDAGGGIIGAGNSVDNSQAWNWSSTQTNQQTDSSSRSYQDSGNTSWSSDSHNTWTNTDGGAIAGMRDVALSQQKVSVDLAKIAQGGADKVVQAAIDSQQNAMSFGSSAMDRAYTFANGAATTAANTVAKSSGEVLGMAKELMQGAREQAASAAGTVQAAYSNAASQANGNKTLVIAALAAVGVLGVAVALRKN